MSDDEALCQQLAAANERVKELEAQRIELVTAVHTLANHYENALFLAKGDEEQLRKSQGDIAHALKIAAKHNYNGGAAPQPAAQPEQTAEPVAKNDRPCHVFTVTKRGPLTEWAPTTMAFALPDGEHALYTAQQPKQRQPMTPKEYKPPRDMGINQRIGYRKGWIDCQAAHGITKGD